MTAVGKKIRLEFKALGNNVVIKRASTEHTSSGGILMPEQYQRTLPQGHIISKGPDFEGAEIGDFVLIKDFQGRDFEHEGQMYTIVPQEDVLSVLVFAK